ncbi:MAG: phage protein Gp36 family protein [bacterium]
MNYSTNDDILLEISEEDLAKLTGDTTGMTVDYDQIEAARNSSDELITSYLSNGYTITESFVNPLVTKISVDLTIAALYEQAKKNTMMPETIALRKKNALSILERIRKGEILISSARTKTIFSNITGARIFDKQTLAEYSGN